jgi:hypothetical protein
MKVRFAVPIALVVCGLSFVVFQREPIFSYYPSPEQKSAFMNSYNPEDAIAKFTYKDASQWGSEEGSSGNRFVTHKTEFREHYTASKQSDVSVMAAVEDDIQRQLSLNRARFLGRKKDNRGVVRIDYQSDQVLGSITIDPITTTQPASSNGGHAMPADAEDKLLHVSVEEKWFPKGIPSQWMLAVANE